MQACLCVHFPYATKSDFLRLHALLYKVKGCKLTLIPPQFFSVMKMLSAFLCQLHVIKCI